MLEPVITVKADPLASGTLQNEARVEGGGAAPAVAITPIAISSSVAPFGFISGEEGFSAPLTSADGSAAVQAGSHPNQLTVAVRLPLRKPRQRP